MRGVAKFKLEGRDFTIPVPLSVVEAIEAQTDKGAMRLLQDILTREARIGHIVTVIQTALNANQQIGEYSRDEIAAMISGNVLTGFIAAGRILGAVFEAPEAAKSAKGKANGKSEASP